MSRQTGGRGAASPAVVFLSLLALLGIVVGAVIWAGQTDQSPLPPAPAGSPEPTDNSLTDAEAIARFKELDALRIRAYATADVTKVEEIFTPSSPTARRVRSELQLLAKDEVHSETQFITRSLRVLPSSPDQVRVRQVVVVRPEFRDENGRDVTGHKKDELQVIDWFLRPHAGNWLIHDSQVIRARPAR